MPSHSKKITRGKVGLALGAGCTLAAAPLFVAPGHRGAPSQVQERTAQKEPAAEAVKESSDMFSVPAAGIALMGTAVLASQVKSMSQRTQGTKVVRNAFENELGVQAPVGFWDPVGFTKDGDVEEFTRRRGVEVKHGRIAMLATMGYITPELTGKFPGYLSPSNGLTYEDIPNGLAAISKVPQAGWAQILAYCLFVEATSNYGASPDCGWKPPLLATDDAELKTKRLNAEIANGRLAMMAIIGMFFQDGLTGSAWGDWALYTDSPLRAFENELGVQAPVGFFDPLGLARDGDAATFKRRRATEIKHGRIAMYATMGYIVPEYYKFPGLLSPSEGLAFTDVPNGLAAVSKVPLLGWLQVLFFAGSIEATGFFSGGPVPIGFMKDSTEEDEPGNYGVGFPTFAGRVTDPEERTKKLSAELANGRLAMMAIIGMFFQDGLTGSAWGDWALYTDSPLRAFENELGVQPPMGFWDPIGFTRDGDAEAFARRRGTEVKHGRISMLATMGYITPELTGKFPGYLSPSAGLQFDDIPNGLGAISKVPAAGIAQIVAYAFFCEFQSGFSAGPDFGWKPPGLATTDPELKTKRLNAEIANGRLAMMAIIGMFFQDGLTGSAWGDWANYTDSPLRAFEGELGVQAPVGFWDPLGLSSDGDAAVFRRRRATEIKHGRVAMLATMGYITPDLVGKFPGFLSPSSGLAYEDIPNGLAAISKVPGAGWFQIVAYCLYCESTGGFGYNADQSKIEPGDCGWKPPLLATDDPELKKKRLNAEIANGRLAMMAIIGMFFQDGLTGSAWGDWANYTDSPLRAFENELGVQAPVGFWDPLGLSADGDAAVFARRRETEIKHGRVSMLATMGYITPELTGKFPGYLSPSLGLKYEDIPNGLAALSKVPLAGWFQIVLYCLYTEASGLGFGYFDDAKKEPGDKGWKPPLLATSDPELKKKRLNAELANGRLAMMAIIGMFFQDGLTGSAWGDWALYTDSPLRAFENELGVQAPVGFWDPIGWTKDGDTAAFARRRAVEIKHGRISMLATMGYITPELTGKFPGYLSESQGIKYTDIPNGLAAISKVPAAGWAQIVLYCLYVEATSGFGFNSSGDLGWKPPFLATEDAGLRTRRLNAEIANGRLAMMAIIGMFFQDGLTGSAWGDWALYKASPIRAFESELGVQPPVGFWDPLGLSKDGDITAFTRRRETEIKHGRIAMLATMGYITPELTGKFPGYLSPSAGLTFEDVPNGLAAISKVPQAGWIQVAAYCLFVEAPGAFGGKAKPAPGDFGFKPPLLATNDPELRTKRLNAELANGRLAMMAIIGMFFQDGLTGSAWGDWANYTDSPLR